MFNLSNINHKHLYCYFILIVLCFIGCDFPVTDTLVNEVLNNIEPTTYARDLSRDIKLQVPDHLIHIPSLWHSCPEGVSSCSPRVDYFTDTSTTLSSGVMAMTEDRIYVPDGAGLNIYAFNHEGEFIEDETISRKPLGADGSRARVEGSSSDYCSRIDTNGTQIYIEVRYTPFRGLINTEAIISLDIASKSLIKVRKLGGVGSRQTDLAFATDDLLYLKYYPNGSSQEEWDLHAKDIFRAYSRYFMEPQPELNIKLQHDYQFLWQKENIPPTYSGAFSIPAEDFVSGNVSHAAERALTGLTHIFYNHDHQLIFIEAANNVWGAFRINGEYAGIEFVSEKWYGSPQYLNNRVYFMDRPREEGVKGDYYIRCYDVVFAK